MARLVNYVHVDGHGWVAPDTDVDPEVAALITNPKAWKAGHTPQGVDEDADSTTASAEPDETWKADRLRAHAEQQGIDVKGLRSKADLLDALKAHKK